MKLFGAFIIFLVVPFSLMGMEKQQLSEIKIKRKSGYSSEEKWNGSFRRKANKSMMNDADLDVSSGSISTNSSTSEDSLEIRAESLANQFFARNHTGEESYFSSLQEKIYELQQSSPELYNRIAALIEKNKNDKQPCNNFFSEDNELRTSSAHLMSSAIVTALEKKALKTKKLCLRRNLVCGACSLCLFVSSVGFISSMLPIILICYA